MLRAFKRVLLAEDDPEDLEILQMAFEVVCPDITVTVTRNGIELVNLLNTIQIPDLIVLDINMPLKSGKQCLVEIRSKKHYDVVPVFMLSATARPEDIDFCLEHGAEKYLIKPKLFSKVVELVEDICGEKV